jgi:Lsr2
VAQRIEVRLPDDLTGTEIPAGETVAFSLDGRTYEIDLITKNAATLRTVLRPYIDAGRTVNRTLRRTARTKVAADTRTVKRWARANGYQVRDRGRVPNEVLAAFEAAN